MGHTPLRVPCMLPRQQAARYRHLPQHGTGQCSLRTRQPHARCARRAAAPQASLPELPAGVRARYASLGLSQYDVLVLADELAVARYFDALLAAGAPPKPAANWVMGDVMAAAKELPGGFEALPMAPGALAEMIALIEDGTISGKIGKQVGRPRPVLEGSEEARVPQAHAQGVPVQARGAGACRAAAR